MFRKDEKEMLKVGGLVEVVKPFYWYEDKRHETGERFTIQEQHIGHNFESYVKVITE